MQHFFRIVITSLLLVLVGGFGICHAQNSKYQIIPKSFDGIGKLYMGREISQVMGWQGAFWLERKERQKEERTDLLLPLLNVVPGMVVADIGAGTGYFSKGLAQLVSSSGTVYAVDIQAEMVKMLTELVQQSGLKQIKPLQSSLTSLPLPRAGLDLAIMVDVYHELEYPDEVLGSLVESIKPGGRVVFVEYRAEDSQVPIKKLHKMSIAQIRLEAQQQGLIWERTENNLPWQHVVIFRKR